MRILADKDMMRFSLPLFLLSLLAADGVFAICFWYLRKHNRRCSRKETPACGRR